MLKLAVVLCVIFVCVFADIDIVDPEDKPEKYKHYRGCYISEFDKVIAVGSKTMSKTSCMTYHCLGDLMEVETCGDLGVDEDQEMTRRHSHKPYPKCCPVASAATWS